MSETPSRERFNVLISSAGRRVALMNAFRDALRALDLAGDLLAVDMSPASAAFQSADRAFTVPRCTSEGFVPRMLEICEREQVRLVVPTIDTELAAYAASRARFEAIGTRVAISSPEAIHICSDKLHTHSWLTEEGFPTVRQAPAEAVADDPAGWAFPLIAKPIAGSSSIGVTRVRDIEELRVVAARGGYVAQSIAPGKEYTVSTWTDGAGRCHCAVPRRRLEVRHGEVDKGMTMRSEPLESLAMAISERLPGAYGAMNVQIFLDRASGELNVIEINPRYGGGFPLAFEAGARYTEWMIADILGRPTGARADAWRDGLVMLRWADAIFADRSELGIDRDA